MPVEYRAAATLRKLARLKEFQSPIVRPAAEFMLWDGAIGEYAEACSTGRDIDARFDSVLSAIMTVGNLEDAQKLLKSVSELSK